MEDLEIKSRIYVNLNSIGYKPTREEIEEEYGFAAEEVSAPEPVIKASDSRDGKTKEDKGKVEEVIDDYLKEIFESVK